MIVVLTNEHISIASLLQTHSCYFVLCNQIVRHIQSENNRFPVECDPRDPHRSPKKSNRAAVVLESLAAEALSLENGDKSLRKLALLKLKEITSSSANKSHEGSLNPLSPEQFFASPYLVGFPEMSKRYFDFIGENFFCDFKYSSSKKNSLIFFRPLELVKGNDLMVEGSRQNITISWLNLYNLIT